MSGLKYLLDTNFILGLLKAEPQVLAVLSQRELMASECAFSAVTRMELLGYFGICASEDGLIRERLSKFTYLAVTAAVEDKAIALRRNRKVKLPDAIIAGTAIHYKLELLTFDTALLAVVAQADLQSIKP